MTVYAQLLVLAAVFLWVVYLNVVRCRSCRCTEIHWLDTLTDWGGFKANDWIVSLFLFLVLVLTVLA